MSCTALTIKGISNDCGLSKGGIRNVWIHKYPESGTMFTQDAKASTDNISGASTGYTYTVTALTETTGWKKFGFRKNTGSMTSTATIDDANGVCYVTTELNLVFTKMDTPKRVELVSLMLDDVCVIVEDCNGVFYALGVEEPVRMTAGTGETGTAKADGNKYSVTLTDEQGEFPPMLADNVRPTE